MTDRSTPRSRFLARLVPGTPIVSQFGAANPKIMRHVVRVRSKDATLTGQKDPTRESYLTYPAAADVTEPEPGYFVIANDVFDNDPRFSLIYDFRAETIAEVGVS